MDNTGEIVIYKDTTGIIKVDVLFQGETVWLTQKMMAELFGVEVPAISKHLNNIYDSGELSKEATISILETVQQEGNRNVKRNVEFYNLDSIIAVGYRVNSYLATQFRIWATQTLKDYIIKGYVLNDERFKTGQSMNYFDELIDRIREIRISEKFFYQKIKDIYTTSIDYNPDSEVTQTFFATVQNKFLWAISGQTAAEIIHARSNAQLPYMGLTTIHQNSKGKAVKKGDIHYAKNYLNDDELAALKLLVEQYLAFAESQALAHKPMYMADWIKKLNDILTMNDKEILTHAGHITHKLALQKADKEFDNYQQKQRLLEQKQSFTELVNDVKKAAIPTRKAPTRKK